MKRDSRAPQHGTTRQHRTTEHRTQHRGAGHHNKPQQIAGQQATRPGRRIYDNTHQRKTTAGDQTQQRTASNHRQQHAAPASAGETTRHHQQDTTQCVVVSPFASVVCWCCSGVSWCLAVPCCVLWCCLALWCRGAGLCCVLSFAGGVPFFFKNYFSLFEKVPYGAYL